MKSMLFSALLIAASVGVANAQDGGLLSRIASHGSGQGLCPPGAEVVSVTTSCKSDTCDSGCGCSTPTPQPAADCGCGGSVALPASSDCGCGGSATPASSSSCGCSDGCGADRGPRRRLGDTGSGLYRRLGDNTGMALRLTDRGSACGSRSGESCSGGCRNGGQLLERLQSRPGRGCGCKASAATPAVELVSSDCGCGDEVAPATEIPADDGPGGLLGKLRDKRTAGGCSDGSCRLGQRAKVRSLGDGAGAIGCGSGGCGIGGGKIGCGIGGCGGITGGICGSCLSKLKAHGQHPYGGAIPHTAQGPGAGTGTAPSYSYPYYTTRGPRDFLQKNPPTIGY